MIFRRGKSKLFNISIFKRKRRKFYTFKLADFEQVFLKKLENNKIFYNGHIYDENFFYYDKLNELFEHINKQRDFYIKRMFESIFDKAKRDKKVLRVIEFYIESNGECPNLTKEQYEIVVDAYTYNIPYFEFEDYFYPSIKLYNPDNPGNFTVIKDLIPDWLYINGWKSIKPVYGVFEPVSYKFYNDGVAVYRESNYDHPLVKYGFTRMLNPQFPKDNPNETMWGFDGFYMHQWCIKPEFHKEMVEESYKKIILAGDFFGEREGDFSDDDIIEENENDWHLPSYNETKKRIKAKEYPHFLDTENDLFFDKSEFTKIDDVFIPKYNIFNEGSRVRYEWLDYDENKKFQEFDINCKTNTYYMRYKYYNEVAWKDYPEEKKYKTKVVHDFTDEEIKADYDNMTDKTKKAVDRIEYVIKHHRVYDNLMDFLKQLEFIDLYLLKYANQLKLPTADGFYGTKTDTDLWTYNRNKRRYFELLNDPQYILMMPLLDAFFEMWRSNGWYLADGTFNDYVLCYSGHFYYPEDCRRLVKAQEIYALTRERQQFEVVNDCWATQDYIEYVIHEEIGDDIDDLIIGLSMALVLFAWLLLITIYFGAYWGPVLHSGFRSAAVKDLYIHSWSLYDYYRPKLLWDIELKGPRNRLPHGRRFKRLSWRLTHYSRYYTYKYRYFRPWLWAKPSYMGHAFYEENLLRNWRKRRSLLRLLPASLIWKAQVTMDNDKKCFGLYSIHENLVHFGRRTAISIYDLDGKLRVRWWTRLHIYIKDSITNFVIQLYTDIYTYVNEPKKELEGLRNARGGVRNPTELETAEAEKEYRRRIRVVAFMTFMVFLIVLLITWICCYFIYHAIANFFAEIFDSDL